MATTPQVQSTQVDITLVGKLFKLPQVLPDTKIEEYGLDEVVCSPLIQYTNSIMKCEDKGNKEWCEPSDGDDPRTFPDTIKNQIMSMPTELGADAPANTKLRPPNPNVFVCLLCVAHNAVHNFCLPEDVCSASPWKSIHMMDHCWKWLLNFLAPSFGTASKTPPSNDLHVQNMELVQCYVGTERLFWDMPFAEHGLLAPRGWMAFTWQEQSKTSLLLKGPLATIPPRRALDLSINEVMVREKWEPSRHKLLNEVQLHMGVTYLSDVCNVAGTHILPEVWNCQCQSNTLRAPSWPNVKAPGRHSKAAWQSMHQSLFILPGHSHCQLASPLGDWLIPLDAHFIWWNDPITDTLCEHRQPHEWHTWTALPRRCQHRRFSHVGSSDKGPPLIVLMQRSECPGP